MIRLTSTWDWACRFVGDPGSYDTRGEMFLTFLKEEGLTVQDHVLELGCGNLSTGAPLIRFLAHDRYFGVEPNGWLVNCALERFRELESKVPQFSWRTDFDVAQETNTKFRFILAHSVLSHVAFWQMGTALHKMRAVAQEGAIWLATVRLDQYDEFAEEWAYPGVNKFRIDTIRALAFHAGWATERVPEYEQRLQEVAPNDVHEVLRFRAVLTPRQANDLTLDIEQRQREETEVRELAKEERMRRESERVEELVSQMDEAQ